MRITIAQCSDWQALYINGDKVSEDHRLNAEDVLRALDRAGAGTTPINSIEAVIYDLKDEWVERHGMPEYDCVLEMKFKPRKA